MIATILFGALVVLAAYVASHRMSGLQTLAALTFLGCGCVLVISPSLAEEVATALRVGRGVDLVTYFSIVGGMFVAANYYFRFKRQEQQLITTVRALALLRTVDESDEI